MLGNIFGRILDGEEIEPVQYSFNDMFDFIEEEVNRSLSHRMKREVINED